MDKQEDSFLLRIYLGLMFFFLLLLIVISSSNFGLINIAIFAILFSLSICFYISTGFRKLKELGIKIGPKIVKDVRIVPMLVGFILMGLGMGVLAITHPVIYPDGSPTGTFWHPFVQQSFILFFAGVGIQLLELVWYHDSVTSKQFEARKANKEAMEKPIKPT